MDNFTVADLVKILTDEYEVDEATATSDILKLTAQWGIAGILEGDDIPVLKEKTNNEISPKESTKPAVKEEKKERKGFFKKLSSNKLASLLPADGAYTGPYNASLQSRSASAPLHPPAALSPAAWCLPLSYRVIR